MRLYKWSVKEIMDICDLFLIIYYIVGASFKFSDSEDSYFIYGWFAFLANVNVFHVEYKKIKEPMEQNEY